MMDEEWAIGLLLLNCIGKIETMTRVIILAILF